MIYTPMYNIFYEIYLFIEKYYAIKGDALFNWKRLK